MEGSGFDVSVALDRGGDHSGVGGRGGFLTIDAAIAWCQEQALHYRPSMMTFEELAREYEL